MGRRRADGSIEVEGLAPFVRELKAMEDQGLAGELKQTNFEVASIIVDDATKKARQLGSTAAHAIAAGGLKAAKLQAAAAVTLGGPRAPEAIGAEFGAKRFPQFKPWRGAGEGAGYFLWPTIRDDEDVIFAAYGEALDRITSKAFPD